jgi:hypothetical protein
MGIYQSSGRSTNPLGFFSVLIGAFGAGASAVLWAYQSDPNGAIVRTIASKLGPGFALGDGLVLTALICGVFTVALAIVGALGGSIKGSAVVSIVFGVVALSYPILTKLDVITRPIVQHFHP